MKRLSDRVASPTARSDPNDGTGHAADVPNEEAGGCQSPLPPLAPSADHHLW